MDAIKESTMTNDTKIFVAAGAVKMKQERNSKTIIQLTNGNLIGLNDTASFIFSICDNLTIYEIAQKLYHNCIDKDEISFDLILNDCIAVLGQMKLQGIIVSQ